MTRSTASPTHMKRLTLALTLALALASALTAAAVQAKLPVPSDEAKAKAAEVAARAAFSGKVDSYKLCLAMDRVAGGYQAAAKQAGRPASAPVDTPACADPGAFVDPPVVAASGAAAAVVAGAKPGQGPLESAGAHSPTKTAAAPPSSLVPAAQSAPTPAKK